MSPLKTARFNNVGHAVKALSMIPFPMLISFIGSNATYNHAVVIWQNMIIDYEAVYAYPLTDSSLIQICRVNTRYQGIHFGVGIYPSSNMCNLDANRTVMNWGWKDYQHGWLRKFFK